MREKRLSFFESAEQGYPPGIFYYAVICSLSEGIDEEVVWSRSDEALESRLDMALEWFIKGGIDETHVPAHRRAISECQRNNVASNFWAQQAKRNGQPMADELCRILNDSIWCACAFCGEESPKKSCNACHGVAYCNRACQGNDWPQHKVVCRSLPKIIPKPMEYPIAYVAAALLRILRNDVVTIMEPTIVTTMSARRSIGQYIAANVRIFGKQPERLR